MTPLCIIILAVIIVHANQEKPIRVEPPVLCDFKQDERELEEGFFCELAQWRWDK